MYSSTLHIICIRQGIFFSNKISEIHLHVNIGGKDFVIVISTIGADPALLHGTGKTIHFEFDQTQMQYFDAATEKNLFK